MINGFQLLDVVVLLSDIPSDKLRKGSLGTIVEIFADSTYLIEFADQTGATYALPTVSESDLLKIYQEPVEA